jgi:hypothetical protein
MPGFASPPSRYKSPVSRPWRVLQTFKMVAIEAPSPFRDTRNPGLQTPGNLARGNSFCRQQNHFRPFHHPMFLCAGPGPRVQCLPFRICENDSHCSPRHSPILHSYFNYGKYVLGPFYTGIT